MKNINHLLSIIATKKGFFFLVTLLITLIIWVTGTDHSLFFTINAQHELLPVAVWDALNIIASPSSVILPAVLLLLTLCFQRDKWVSVVLLIVAYYVVFELLKFVIYSPRPYAIYDSSTFFWRPLKSVYITKFITNQSFPSGHVGNVAIFVFAFIHLFASKKTWLQVLLLLFLLLVMLTRICTGWHFPLDVLASVLVGFILTEIWWYVARIHQKRT